MRISLFALLILFSQQLSAESDLQKIFSDIYRDGIWGTDEFGRGTSGGGSTPQEFQPFVDYLHNFLSETPIQSIVDVGCGDWVLGRSINWGDRDYLGIDIVPELIERNQASFTKENIHFLHLNASEEELPKADLLICKDVLQHLSLSEISNILAQTRKFKYVLFVNDVFSWSPYTNSESLIEPYHYRPLDLRKPPFNLRPDNLEYYTSGDKKKQIFLIVNQVRP